MMSSHYNIATSGIRAGHKAITSMGIGTFIQVVVTQLPSVDGGGGGGGGGGTYHSPHEERRYQAHPLFSLIWIEFYGKEVNFPFYQVYNDKRIKIEVNLFKYNICEKTHARIDVELISTSTRVIEPPTIIIKEKSYDSIERKEQPRIHVEYPKLNKSS